MIADKFIFATGIENSYPNIKLPGGSIKRVDEMEKCGHYKNWQLDFYGMAHPIIKRIWPPENTTGYLRMILFTG
jgi:hypothetical protein